MLRNYTLPILDFASDTWRQTIVDREPGVYLGHPTTVLLDDGKTMVTVYPKNHGFGQIVLKKSMDGGLTWSERLPVPESWSTSLETPILYKVYDKTGKCRLIMFSSLYPIRMSVSEDDGDTWSELAPVGDYGGIVAMGDIANTAPGEYFALFH
ncbi:MAG TPA: exo-alpha-sialidase, partial [Lentisphaeria bacterium]|nr:exo-alpha-sialidase [Lentisphaeria bacterium]